MSNSVKHFHDFGRFRIDVAKRLLLRDDQPLPLTPKAVETLLALVQRNGEIVSKDELMKMVWPDSVVEEGNLTQNIYLLRKTLSEGSDGQNYIETIPRRGYRFVGETRQSQGGSGEEGSGGVGEVGSVGSEEAGSTAGVAHRRVSVEETVEREGASSNRSGGDEVKRRSGSGEVIKGSGSGEVIKGSGSGEVIKGSSGDADIKGSGGEDSKQASGEGSRGSSAKDARGSDDKDVRGSSDKDARGSSGEDSVALSFPVPHALSPHLPTSPTPHLPTSPTPHLPSSPIPPLHISASRRRRLVAIALIAVVVIAGLIYLKISSRPKAAGDVASIAVLPFRSLTGGGEDKDLGMGMTDALITQLSNIKGITVRPTSAVLKYSDSVPDLLAVGHELGVDAVLDGRFQRADGRLRVTVQLVSMRDGASLWADKFDEQFTSLFAVQDAITERMMRVMAARLSRDEQRQLSKRFGANPEAYQAYLQGCYYLDKQDTRILESSIAHFHQALSFDPDYAPAYAGLADCYVLLAFQYDAREQDQIEAVPKAQEAAARALQLDDQLPEAHAALGAVRQYLDSDFQGAENEYRRAIELNPNYAHAHHSYAILLFTIGRLEEAEREITRALELDPLSVSIAKNAADGFYMVRQYDEAIEQYRRALQMDPTATEARRDLGWAYACKGMPAAAAAEFIEEMRLQNAGPERLAAVRRAYESAGLKGFWREWLKFQQGRIRYGRLDPSYLAMVYAFLGDQDQAFTWLQKAYEDRSIDPAVLRFDPVFDRLRSDTRYTTLLNSVTVLRKG